MKDFSQQQGKAKFVSSWLLIDLNILNPKLICTDKASGRLLAGQLSVPTFGRLIIDWQLLIF